MAIKRQRATGESQNFQMQMQGSSFDMQPPTTANNN